MKHQPPKWINQILEWFCARDELEVIQGDLFELYEKRAKDRGKVKANWMFLMDVMAAFRWLNWRRPQLLRKLTGQLILTSSYLKIGARNLWKYPLIYGINIVGLSVALAICITAIIFYDVQVHMDEFHTKGDRIYQITALKGNTIDSNTPMQLGPSLLSDQPIVQGITRIERQGAYVKHRTDVFEERITFVDPSFFRIFDFPFLDGNEKSLTSKNSIVISYDMAKKYFPEEDPIGQSLEVRYRGDTRKTFTVTGVLDQYSDYASFIYDFYLPFENLTELTPTGNQWLSSIDATFILLQPESNISQLIYNNYLSAINEREQSEPLVGFKAYPLYELSENCHDINASVSFTAPAFTRITLLIIGGMLLLLTIFGFINITLTSYARRLKEIGIRKAIGGNQRQVIYQFIIENFLVCAVAFVLGLILSYSVFTRGLDYLIPLRIPFSFSSWEFMIISGSGLFIITLLITGLYPAISISKLPANRILKGVGHLRKNSPFSRVLLGFQLCLAFITVVGSVVFTAHTIKLNHVEWGYLPDDLVIFRTTDPNQLKQFTHKLGQSPYLKSMSVSSSGHVGVHNIQAKYQYENLEHEATTFEVDSAYQYVLGLKLKSGRWFDGTTTDYRKSVIVNEALVNFHGWDNPLGKVLELDSRSRKVIGVVNDFHYNSVAHRIQPLIFSGINKDSFRYVHYIAALSTPGKSVDLKARANNIWEEIAPDEPFTSRFQQQVFDIFYEETRSVNFVLIVLCAIAILISSLGLFGLLSYNIQRRLKELSIRKVLGASPLNLTFRAVKGLIGVVILGLVFGGVFGYWLIDSLLSLMYSARLETGFLPYTAASLGMLIILALTLLSQVSAAVKANPVENLKDE